MAAAVQICPAGKLVYGMQLPITAQSTVFAAPWEATAGTDEIRRIAQACDANGFFYLAVSDHVCVPRAQATAMSTVWYDTVATLGFLAAATRHVRLLSYVYVVPYRHPLVTAKAFATLDALSGGRVILGVGAGHLKGEFETLGVDFARRGKLLDEAIDVIAAAFTEEFPSHRGAAWSVRDMGQRPRPVQQPRPPIWVGGSTRPALRRAAERGDGWLPQGVPEMGMPAAIEIIRTHRVKVRGAAPIEMGMNAPWMYVGTPTFAVPPNTRTGSGDALAAPLREMKTMGVSHCGVRFRSRSCDELVDQINAFGSVVAPLLND
ncbi:MAG TPA: TIGR03619 family F420-dependent LLM class oxidoreductase [Candidatus Margulisiibacteriota bacterium]|nr:TIGR03619 family F420-dependent LLM class oxidoreductase [Candidatus Margulisiibacteriota bacterium]